MTAMKFVSKLFKFKGFGAVDVCYRENLGATFNRCGKREKATLTFHYTVPTKTAR